MVWGVSEKAENALNSIFIKIEKNTKYKIFQAHAHKLHSGHYSNYKQNELDAFFGKSDTCANTSFLNQWIHVSKHCWDLLIILDQHMFRYQNLRFSLKETLIPQVIIHVRMSPLNVTTTFLTVRLRVNLKHAWKCAILSATADVYGTCWGTSGISKMNESLPFSRPLLSLQLPHHRCWWEPWPLARTDSGRTD